MRKNELFKPVTRTLNGITMTFTSKRELEAYDNMLRKMVEENRKKAENGGNSSPYAKEVVFEPDFTL